MLLNQQYMHIYRKYLKNEASRMSQLPSEQSYDNLWPPSMVPVKTEGDILKVTRS